jgi:hypothetical protein
MKAMNYETEYPARNNYTQAICRVCQFPLDLQASVLHLFVDDPLPTHIHPQCEKIAQLSDLAHRMGAWLAVIEDAELCNFLLENEVAEYASLLAEYRTLCPTARLAKGGRGS